MTTEIDELIAEYLSEGVLDVAVDDSGEVVYKLGPNAKEKAPELYKAFLEEIDEALISLWQKGFLELHYDENLVPSFSISSQGKEVLDWSE